MRAKISLTTPAIVSTKWASDAIDGDTYSSWSSNSGPSDEWFQLDLGSAIALAEFKILSDYTWYLDGFDLQTLVDGTNWIDQGSYTLADPDEWYSIDFTGTWQYIKLKDMNTTASYMEIAEIEVLGPGCGTE